MKRLTEMERDQKTMDEFVATYSYDVPGDWRNDPETDIEPDDEFITEEDHRMAEETEKAEAAAAAEEALKFDP